jgi:methionine-rich copper-binding protein CopC
MKPRSAARRPRSAFAVAALTFTALLTAPAAPASALGPCDGGGNKITCENSLPGNPSSQWDTNPQGTVEGYADQMSVNLGQTVNFKLRSPALSLQVDIYRMGYYQGNGARKIITVPATTAVSRFQPNCPENTTTGEVACDWGTVASWTVPTTAVSGIYFAHVVRPDSGDDTHVVFVVRDDAGTSDLLFRTADSTWQAYNSWGDIPATEDNPNKVLNSLYRGDSVAAPGRAVKVSYNRPFNTRESTPWGRDFVFANEYPMVRWLEANGYSVSYQASADAGRAPSTLLGKKALLSVGHDEYWSGEERAAFEAARDSGVNLAFFSGNEVYWKTRWENSHRTLVSYKETLANAKIDPTPGVWTGTWRDKRFSPPADGGQPENGLTGTLFTVNCTSSDNGCQAIPLTVPAADGKMRFWRGTSVAGLFSGSMSIPGLVGYEWDEDLDNGSRPKGLVRLSTTTAMAEQVLVDEGKTVVEQSATHRMTLYRAPSGALVFGAGTVQWTWGLDDEHDSYDTETYADTRIKQATVNLFADMDVQPKSLTSGLSTATKSTDVAAPTATITAPAPATTVGNGSTVTVSGTALDLGGQVGAVEVSTDGGATWHPATGRTTWTYSWKVTGVGATTIKVRAADDSGNVGAEASRVVTVECPCSLFSSSTVPANPAENDGTALELGVRFTPSVNGYLTGVKFYKGTGNTGTHTGTLWSSTGTPLATGTFTGESSTGWQTLDFSSPVHVTAGTEYIATYYAPNGHYAADGNYFRYQPLVNAPLTAPKATESAGNGVYRVGAGFPNQTYNGGNYYVDVVFTVNDVYAPAVNSATPVPGSSSVPVTVQPQVTFGEPIQAGTATFTVRDATEAAIAGTVSLDATRKTLTFVPAAPLAPGEPFTVSVVGALDDAGNTMTEPHEFTFTTAKPWAAGVCPCTIWPDVTVPDNPSVNDGAAVEIGVKFQASTDGFVEGIRFYKGPGNTGTHAGTLWSATGQELTTATFTDESTQGWQEVYFGTPWPVTRDTTYVASYHAPNGHYAATSNGLASAVTATPLRTLASGSSGGNGVYRYGTHAFPTSSWGASNYWVDVIFTKLADTTAPYVTLKSPDHGGTGVATGTAVTATFSEPIVESTATITVKDTADQPVAGTRSLSQSGTLLTFTPDDPLAQSTTYTVTVSGAEDDAENAMITTSWSFTTGGPASCPCSIFASNALPVTPSINDSSSVELGVKFTAEMDGQVTGVRFYKGAGNTGTHVGNLWSATGTALATGTFVNESASGWQTLMFDVPVDVVAGQVYVASYLAPDGHYAGDGGYFNAGPVSNSPLTAMANGGAAGANGVYRYGAASGFPTASFNGANYWVDVLFTPSS